MNFICMTILLILSIVAASFTNGRPLGGKDLQADTNAACDGEEEVLEKAKKERRSPQVEDGEDEEAVVETESGENGVEDGEDEEDGVQDGEDGVEAELEENSAEDGAEAELEENSAEDGAENGVEAELGEGGAVGAEGGEGEAGVDGVKADGEKEMTIKMYRVVPGK